MKKSKRPSQKIVVKVGSSLLTGGGSYIVEANLSRIVRHVAGFVNNGDDVIVVTSGAIASGLSLLGFKKRPKSLSELQAAAAVGQNLLIQSYSRELEKFGLTCAQILLTRDDFYDHQRYQNIRHTIDALLRHKVIPVINENDAVSVDEIKFGDNDTLSARIAVAVEADGHLMLTDIDGLCENFDPKTKTGTLIKDTPITPDVEKIARGTDKIFCVGGMMTKVEAARIATNMGIPSICASGIKESLNINFDLSSSDPHDGTRFHPPARPLGARKHWIGFEARTCGKVRVDDGAKKALTHHFRSLLAPGVVGVEGSFKAGDVVEVEDTCGRVFAKGRANFSSSQLFEVKGRKINEEVIHRDDLVILG